jgi:phage terminase large subunit-like protein
MIQAAPGLEKRCRIFSSRKRIETKAGGNELRVVSSDGHRQHGLNPSLLLFDELHTQKDRRLYEALTSAQATRLEPLTLLITTAGNDRYSLCYEQYDYARKVRDGKVVNPSFLPIIYEAGPDDPWDDERTWAKAMPALGDFCQLDYFREGCNRVDARDYAAFLGHLFPEPS